MQFRRFLSQSHAVPCKTTSLPTNYVAALISRNDLKRPCCDHLKPLLHYQDISRHGRRRTWTQHGFLQPDSSLQIRHDQYLPLLGQLYDVLDPRMRITIDHPCTSVERPTTVLKFRKKMQNNKIFVEKRRNFRSRLWSHTRAKMLYVYDVVLLLRFYGLTT